MVEIKTAEGVKQCGDEREEKVKGEGVERVVSSGDALDVWKPERGGLDMSWGGTGGICDG